MRRSAVVSLVVGVVFSMLVSASSAEDRTQRASGRPGRAGPAKRADFNGDGFTDLAVGAPSGGTDHSGAVSIVFGGPNGLSITNLDTLSPQNGAPDDAFGQSMASADFDGDGFADLAVGIPFREVGGVTDAGQVDLLFGNGDGILGTRHRVITESTAGVPGDPAQDDWFGSSLAAGDFNGDGHPDLAIGVAGRTVSGQPQGGAVDVLPGGPHGPTGTGATTFNPATHGIAGDPHSSGQFGSSLASGNLGRGPQADLAIGSFGDRVGGSATVLFGGAAGLHASGSQRCAPKSAGQTVPATQAEVFGWSVAIGNVGKSADADLIVGAPGATVQGTLNAGAAFVLYGTPQGPVRSGALRLTLVTTGMPTDPAANDRLGEALAVADLDGDGRPDLALSANQKASQPGGTDNSGFVYVVPGGPNGADPLDAVDFSGVDLSGQTVADQLEAGRALTTGQFGRGPGADLAIGIPGLTAGGNANAGGAAVLFGGPNGPSLSRMQLVDGDTFAGFPEDLQAEYGQALVASAKVID